ncbi:AmmeMemoRadiSam system protein B [candidate division KSB1 bacterium]|nr:AmmeMemoRadiSam system protein B [candidate division KSB1 bacterium]
MSKRLWFVAPVLVMVLLFSILRTPKLGDAKEQDEVRRPAVAGQFYPDDPEQLRLLVDRLLDSTAAEAPGKIFGLFVPHAGYAYSASVASAAWAMLKDEGIDLVVILAPSHRDPLTGASVYPGRAYRTPLGEIAIDDKAAKKFVDRCGAVEFSHAGHGGEHALEVQLPFVQRLFPQARILPIVIGRVDAGMNAQIGQDLARVLQGKRAVVVASTDLYHGYSYEEGRLFDDRTLKALQRFEPEKLWQDLCDERCQACGGAAAVIMQIACRELGADRVKIVARTNSNDVTGERGGYVVGYGSGVVYKQMPRVVVHPELGPEEQRELLRIARQAIAAYLQEGKTPQFSSALPMLQEKRGVFVTLERNGQLHGCIGSHESDRPLVQMVADRAVSAAFFDPRFRPLQRHELPEIDIEISVYLTNVYPIASIDEFEMGVHGIILVKDGKSATFLPQVPIEAGWKTKEEELRHLCLKAGLAPDAWEKDAEFWVYRTQVFDEHLLDSNP